MAVTTDTNGRVRKSLAEQIDRLDGILDGLADGLNEAVVTAVKEAVGAAVQEAVRAVLTELLANPDLLHTIRDSLAPLVPADVHPAQPTETKRPRAPVSVLRHRSWAWLRTLVLRARRHLSAWCGWGRRHLGATWAALRGGCRLVSRLRRSVLIALCAGVLVGVAAYLAGPWLCTAAGGLAGFMTSLAVQARQAAQRLTAATSASRP